MGKHPTWFIVLAGGEGRRLAALTRSLYGAAVPKQFAVLDGAASLLQRTVERAAALGEADHIVVVVTNPHAEVARAQLAAYPGVHLLVQPANRDTGPGLLLPLAWIRARAPTARVVVLPADHYLPNLDPLRRALHQAATERGCRGRLTLIGVHAEHPETDYGWIVPGRRLAGGEHAVARAVRRFVEKPDHALAQRLRLRGAVWNTFMATGPVEAFWALGRAALPAQVAAFDRWAHAADAPDADARLATLYRELAPASWSVDVLTGAPADHLAVISMAGSGWSDWGSPHRVFESMAGTPELASLQARMSDPDGPTR